MKSSPDHCDALWLNVNLATLSTGADRQSPYGAIVDGALAICDGKITWLGLRAELPKNLQAKTTHDGGGRWLTPGLIDCHTHIVYAGNRSNEFEARLGGASYEDIARAGGGIAATVAATRTASEEELFALSLTRIKRLLAEGVTTLEIKSGYGLNTETEAKILRVARRMGAQLPVDIKTTFLGAHAVPGEYRGRADDYIAMVCDQMLPDLHGQGLVDAVDAFCENIGFTLVQTERVFAAAKALGLPVKLHAEQLSDSSGAALVARFKGLSADHLEYLSPSGIAAMAKHGTVAVLLPGAFYFLRESQVPPVEALRAAKVPMAVATDCNPGTSPMTSILLAMNMACTLFRLTPGEALQGVTIHAARALGLVDSHGSLEVGKVADLALWDIDRPGDLSYAIGANPCIGVVKAGRWRKADEL